MQVPGVVKVTSPPPERLHPVLDPSSVTVTVKVESEVGAGVHVFVTSSGLTGADGNVIVCGVAARADDAPNDTQPNSASTTAIAKRLMFPITPLPWAETRCLHTSGHDGRGGGRPDYACRAWRTSSNRPIS